MQSVLILILRITNQRPSSFSYVISKLYERRVAACRVTSSFDVPSNNSTPHTRNQKISVVSFISHLYVEIKCQLDATEAFIADLIACSTCFGHQYAHHQELKSIIQWLLPVVFRAVVFTLLVWCGAEGYVSGLQDAVASCKPDT